MAVGLVARVFAAEPLADDAFEAAARRAGLRIVAGDHLLLATDLPERRDDAIDELPRVFDDAFAAWCRHYRLDPAGLAGWRAQGCLVADRERFRAAGLLPDAVPDFANGFCDRGRFWLAEQSNPAYRRHLLLHEGVHAFTLTVRSLAAPPWYAEGIAELLATHRLENRRFTPTPIPRAAADVEQLGRIERLRSLGGSGRPPSLGEVLATPAALHAAIDSYAANWAAVAMLSLHPAYAEAFAELERGPLDAELNERLVGMPGWEMRRAARDFAAFLDEVDYGFRFERSAIDWSDGPPLDAPRTVKVEAGRGWQNAGVTLVAGRRYTLRAAGRCRIAELPPRAIETEADGISLGWYRGRPLGRLLAAQWVDRPEDGGHPRFVILAEGARGGFSAVADGPLHMKLNEPPGDLEDDEGSIEVTLAPAP